MCLLDLVFYKRFVVAKPGYDTTITLRVLVDGRTSYLRLGRSYYKYAFGFYCL